MKLLSILAAILLSANAHAADSGVYVFDASGADGLPGVFDPAKVGKDPNNGIGQPGRPGGYIDVEIGFVPGSDSKMVYIKGFKQPAVKGQKPIPIQETISVSSLKEIKLVARGGNGGNGGNGANGPDGMNGETPRKSPQSGGTGAIGGAGGNGGYVNVRFAAGAEPLLSLVHVFAGVGYGGEGGRGGKGGMGANGNPALDGADGEGGAPGVVGAVYFLNSHSKPITKGPSKPASAKDSAAMAGKLNGMLNSGNSDLEPYEGTIDGQRHPSVVKHDTRPNHADPMEDAKGTEDAGTRSTTVK